MATYPVFREFLPSDDNILLKITTKTIVNIKKQY